MARWWKCDRYVLATRRRLRAGFRGALKSALVREREALAKDYAMKCAELREQAAEMQKGHDDLLMSLWSLGPARLSDYQLEKTLEIRVSLSHEQLVRAKDVNTLVMYLADSMGRGVSAKVIELFVDNARATAHSGR